MNTTTNSVELIHNILELKLKACDEFLSCTQLLGKCLEKEDMKEVTRLVRSREDIKRSINKLDRKITSFRTTIPENDNQRIARHLNTMFADISEKIKQIVKANEDCRVIATNQCAVLANALRESRHEKTVWSRYSKTAKRSPKFLDVRS